MFDCGKTQRAKLNDKESLLSSYEPNASNALVRVSTRTSEHTDINKALLEWHCLACSKNFYPIGPQLIEKARQITELLEGYSKDNASVEHLDPRATALG